MRERGQKRGKDKELKHGYFAMTPNADLKVTTVLGPIMLSRSMTNLHRSVIASVNYTNKHVLCKQPASGARNGHLHTMNTGIGMLQLFLKSM
jgi:hypothetical protein